MLTGFFFNLKFRLTKFWMGGIDVFALISASTTLRKDKMRIKSIP